MNLTAFALVVAAACLHALWNLAAKRVAGNVGVLWLGLCWCGVLLAPFALPSAVRSFDPAGLPYIVATGLIHAAHRSIVRGELVQKVAQVASRRRHPPIPAPSAPVVRRTSRRSSPGSASSAA
jgi:hypothetical protein